MARFILVFVLLFAAELVLLIEIGSVIGAVQCIALMFLSMVIGAVLVKLRAKQLMQQMQETHNVSIKLLWLPLSGFLFIFPGFITDVLALLILLPPVENFLVRRFAGSLHVGTGGFSYSREEYRRGQTINGEFTSVDEEIKFRVIEDSSSDRQDNSRS